MEEKEIQKKKTDSHFLCIVSQILHKSYSLGIYLLSKNMDLTHMFTAINLALNTMWH